jgi:hypothetical protein
LSGWIPQSTTRCAERLSPARSSARIADKATGASALPTFGKWSNFLPTAFSQLSGQPVSGVKGIKSERLSTGINRITVMRSARIEESDTSELNPTGLNR